MTIPDPLYGVAVVLYSNLLVKLPLSTPPANIAEQTIIVTGANSGLGFETSKHLLHMGLGTLIMAVRNLDKGEVAKKELLQSTGRPESAIMVWRLDMDDHSSVKAFARRAADELPRLDSLLANAGLYTTEFRQGQSGLEENLRINVVSTFLLCLLLLPKLRESAAQTGTVGHIVTVNSALHYVAPYKELASAADSDTVSVFKSLNNPETALMDGRYSLSKALVLFVVRELAARDKASSDKSARPLVIVNSPNPSFCKSGLLHEDDSLAARMGLAVVARETQAGSRTLIDGLFAGPESHGQYLNNCHVARPAHHISGKWGQKMQKRVFADLMETLEGIQPGISANI